MSEFSNSNKFFSLSLELGALIFGDFKLKSGLNSPYFFNMSALFGGGAIYELADLYSNLILEKEIDFDIIFGAMKNNLKCVEVPIRYRAREYGETQIDRYRHGILLFKMVWFAYKKMKIMKL